MPGPGRSSGNFPALIQRFWGFREASNRCSTERTDSKYSSRRTRSPELPCLRRALAWSRTRSRTLVSSRCSEVSRRGSLGSMPEITGALLERKRRSKASWGTISLATGVCGSRQEINEPYMRAKPPPAVSMPARVDSTPSSKLGSAVRSPSFWAMSWSTDVPPASRSSPEVRST